MKVIVNNKAITLIALVITIIVLLILAGVSIALFTGENGILTKATTASEQTKQQGTLEKVKLAVAESFDNKGKFNYTDFQNNIKNVEGFEKIDGQNVIVNGTTVKVDSTTGKTTLMVPGIIIPGEAVTQDTIYSDGKEMAIIPKGFKISTKTDEQKISTGLVVIAPDESEFVWVPVPNVISDTEAEATNNKAIAVNLGTTDNPQYRGLIYDFTETTSTVQTGCTTTTEEYREPACLTSDGSDGGPNDIIGITQEKLQTEYNAIINSIKANNGFYIGRYESSLSDSTDITEGKSGNIQSKAGVIPTAADNPNTIMWYGLYDKQQKYAQTLTGTSIKSTMITGSCYDAMLNWALQGNDKTKVTTNNINGNHSGFVTTTGNKAYGNDEINNVYDIEGNLFEWTSEAYYNSIRARI